MVYGIRDIEPILNGQDAFLGTMLDCLIQLNKDLAERDIDMIFMPWRQPHLFTAMTLLTARRPIKIIPLVGLRCSEPIRK